MEIKILNHKKHLIEKKEERRTHGIENNQQHYKFNNHINIYSKCKYS